MAFLFKKLFLIRASLLAHSGSPQAARNAKPRNLPTNPLNPFHEIKVPVLGYDWQTVLLRQRGDPTIIRRDRGAGDFEPTTHFRVKWQCFLLQEKDIDLQQQGIQPSFQFGTVSGFADPKCILPKGNNCHSNAGRRLHQPY
jgi:hypothetical protein